MFTLQTERQLAVFREKKQKINQIDSEWTKCGQIDVRRSSTPLQSVESLHSQQFKCRNKSGSADGLARRWHCCAIDCTLSINFELIFVAVDVAVDCFHFSSSSRQTECADLTENWAQSNVRDDKTENVLFLCSTGGETHACSGSQTTVDSGRANEEGIQFKQTTQRF